MTARNLCLKGNVYIRRLIPLTVIDKPPKVIKRDSTAMHQHVKSAIKLTPNKPGITLPCLRINIYKQE